jgi:hypothetical protein
MSLEVIDITFGEFREWLYNHPDEFFYACAAAGCPVAKFFTDKTGRQVSIGCATMRFWDTNESRVLPSWVTKFTLYFDARFAGGGGKVFSPDVIHFMDRLNWLG